ncbi:MAG TPA: type II toxin-antitoxin system VapC family toxin [Longimicrobiaceae bacterium]|nr:type II toxin-antitoxin system VapC family toxin [Longimicrobiaceae bacterium]
MTEIAITDTHPLVWYARGEYRRLGTSARNVFDAADQGQAVIYVPTVSLVELGEGMWRGRIPIAGSFTSWVDRLFSSRNFVPVDLTTEIVLRAEEFYAIPERGDRLIAATAAHLGYPLITRDPAIAKAAGVELVW